MRLDSKKAGILFLLGVAAALGLTAFVYWSGLSGPFMLDDGPNIEVGFVSNPDWAAIVYTVTHNGSGLFGRSVSMLSFVLSGLQYGLDPEGFKFHNLLLHLLNGFLLFRLLQELLPRLDTKLDSQKVLLIAGGTATVWLVHPLLVSTVLYVVQRMVLLSTLFTLLALLAYLKARVHLADRRFYVFGWILMPLMIVLSVLSKESGALIPVYLLVIELCAFRTRWHDLRQSRRLCIFLGVSILLPLTAALMLLALDFSAFTDYSSRSFTLKERLLTQVHVVYFYLRLILLPRIREMSLFHDDFPVTSSLDGMTLVLLGILAAMLFIAWKMRTKFSVVSFGLLLFFSAHLLESTFIPLELVFEHRNYLASAGILLLPVYALLRADSYPALRLLAPVLIAMFAFMTATRSAEWGNRDLFHQVSVIEHPRSPRALNNLVNYLMGAGRYDDAVVELQKLAQLTPTDIGAVLHMQVARCAEGNRDEAVLARAVTLAEQHPLSVYGHAALQSLTVNVIQDKCGDVLLEDVEQVVTAAFNYAERNQSLAHIDNLYRIRATIAMTRGFYAQGYSDFRVAHEITGNIDLLHELLKYQIRMGRFGDAIETLDLMEQQNSRRFGTDTYVVNESRKLLTEARQRSAAQAPAGNAELPLSVQTPAPPQ